MRHRPRGAIVEHQPDLEVVEGEVQVETPGTGMVTTLAMTQTQKTAAKKREQKKQPFGFGVRH